jgi:hypothetical protein
MCVTAAQLLSCSTFEAYFVHGCVSWRNLVIDAACTHQACTHARMAPPPSSSGCTGDDASKSALLMTHPEDDEAQRSDSALRPLLCANAASRTYGNSGDARAVSQECAKIISSTVITGLCMCVCAVPNNITNIPAILWSLTPDPKFKPHAHLEDLV